MPIIEFFAAAGEAGATDAALADVGTSAFTDAALADAGATALGAETLGGLGATGAGGAGITQAGMAADTIAGGAGAGAADINAAQIAAQQNAAGQVANSGITSAMTPAQQAYMNASTAGINTASSMPLQATTSGGIPADLSANTGWGQAPVEPININPQTSGYGNVIDNGGMNAPQPSALERGWAAFKEAPMPLQFAGTMAAMNALGLNKQGTVNPNQPYNGPLNKYHLSPNFKGITANPQDYQYKAHYAAGGILDAAGGGPVEQMSNNAAIGANTHYPMSSMTTSSFATPYQTPTQQNVIAPSGGATVDQGTGELNPQGTRLAAGGIASYKSGGNLSDTLNYYDDMMEGSAKQMIAEAHRPAPVSHDVGIYRDSDPDTMYLDPVSAAQVRMAKVNKRANMQLPGMKRPTPMGTINLKPQGTKAEASGSSLDPENAAQGGIMHASSHLGSYAAGGQPRLLKGPGDGMSDDIPATIANKQPARLADGEFVVPADVVSHLGNGSTDAGAKKLHGMMDNVRKARTGRKAQGKQIDPNRFMPK